MGRGRRRGAGGLGGGMVGWDVGIVFFCGDVCVDTASNSCDNSNLELYTILLRFCYSSNRIKFYWIVLPLVPSPVSNED